MTAGDMELTNYTVESNSLVTLAFKNGTSKRVRVAQLSRYVLPEDAAKIQQALDLRKNFFKDLPKWAKAFAIPMAVILVGITAVKAAPGLEHVIHPAKVITTQPARQETSALAPEPVAPTVANPTPTPSTATATETNRPTDNIVPATKPLDAKKSKEKGDNVTDQLVKGLFASLDELNPNRH